MIQISNFTRLKSEKCFISTNLAKPEGNVL